MIFWGVLLSVLCSQRPRLAVVFCHSLLLGSSLGSISSTDLGSGQRGAAGW
jgi:hypothetical protein